MKGSLHLRINMYRSLWVFEVASVTIMLYMISGVRSDGEEFSLSKNMFNDMTLENFDRYTKEKDIMLVFYYMPWCRHSKNLQPEWEKAAQVLENKKEYVLARVNCEGSGKSLCERFKISMYPDIRLYRHGKFQETYDGERTAEDILKFIEKAQSTTGPVGNLNSGFNPAPTYPAASVSGQQPQKQFLNQLFAPNNFFPQQQQQPYAFTPQFQQNAPFTQPYGSNHAPAAKDAAPTLMSIYESIYKPKNLPVYQKFSQRSEEAEKPVYTGFVEAAPKGQRQEAAIMNYVFTRHQQIKQLPEYERLLPSLGVSDLKQYYEWKYGQNARPLSEAEKQRRIGLGNFLLNPLKKRTFGKRHKIHRHNKHKKAKKFCIQKF